MDFIIGGAIIFLIGAALFCVSYLRRNEKGFSEGFATAGVVAMTAGLVAFMLAGFVALGKSDGRAETQKALREQRFTVVSVDEYGASAIVRGPGGCTARVTVEQIRGTGQRLVMQGSRIVTPSSVSCP